MNNYPFFSKFSTITLLVFFAGLCTFSYGQSPVEVIRIDTLPKPQTAKLAPSKLRVGAQIGYGHRIALVPDNAPQAFQNHLMKLKKNVNCGADISYFFKDKIGLGAKYNGIYAESFSQHIFYVLNNGSLVADILSNKIRIQYIGPQLVTRFFVEQNKQHCVFVNIGFGYVGYVDNAIVIYNQHIKTTGDAVGFFLEAGFEFRVAKQVAIGFQVAALVSNMTTVSYTSGNITIKDKLGVAEGLSHVDIAFLFNFYK
jgi:outer membrane protein W